MKFLSFAVLALVASSRAEEGRAKEKRGIAGYSTAAPTYASAGPLTYSKQQKTVSAASAAQQYVSQPAAYSVAAPAPQQYYQQAEPQAVAYSQPAVPKYAGVPAVQKFAYETQPQPQQYSSAADVSSFSYSSPVVAYNNLGYLHQIIGKAAGAPQASQQVSYTADPSPKVQQYTQQYNSIAPAANTYSDANAYQTIPQKASYSAAPAQAITYQTAQKVNYPSVPTYQTATQTLQKSAPQFNYVSPSANQFVYQTQQAAPQSYETAHSAPQVYYSQPAPQPQYYSVAPQGKLSRPGVVYSQ